MATITKWQGPRFSERVQKVNNLFDLNLMTIDELNNIDLLMAKLYRLQEKGWSFIIRSNKSSDGEFDVEVLYMQGELDERFASKYTSARLLSTRSWWTILCEMQEQQLRLEADEEKDIEPSNILDLLEDDPEAARKFDENG